MKFKDLEVGQLVYFAGRDTWNGWGTWWGRIVELGSYTRPGRTRGRLFGQPVAIKGAKIEPLF